MYKKIYYFIKRGAFYHTNIVYIYKGLNKNNKNYKNKNNSNKEIIQKLF